MAASDGPRKPIPETTWVKATTAEAAHLELLEGRHPLALAHFANHPPAGAAPNAVIASFNFKLQPAGSSVSSALSDSGSAEQASGSSSSSSEGHARDAPWLRAYVPNIDYCEECSCEHLLNTVRASAGVAPASYEPRSSYCCSTTFSFFRSSSMPCG